LPFIAKLYIPPHIKIFNLVINLTRDRLTEICRDLLILALKPLEDILQSSELSKDDIHEIILVGGMTRMPQIIDNIKKF
jgi:molecular chaperone DnaK